MRDILSEAIAFILIIMLTLVIWLIDRPKALPKKSISSVN
jgi:hypothetical protein